MSEEEKRAIEKIERLVQYFNDWEQEVTIIPEDKKYFKALLNLVEKQQKEINNLKETNKAFHHFIVFNGGKDIEDVTATKYMEIRREGYAEGRQDAQQEIKKIQKELEQEKVISEYWKDSFLEQVKYGNKITVSGDPVIIKNVIDTVTYNYIPKDKIIKFIKEELPEEEICNTCEIYDVNGISIKEKLEKILEEK